MPFEVHSELDEKPESSNEGQQEVKKKKETYRDPKGIGSHVIRVMEIQSVSRIETQNELESSLVSLDASPHCL